MASLTPDWEENVANVYFDELVAEAGVQPGLLAASAAYGAAWANSGSHSSPATSGAGSRGPASPAGQEQLSRRPNCIWLKFLRTEDEGLVADGGLAREGPTEAGGVTLPPAAPGPPQASAGAAGAGAAGAAPPSAVPAPAPVAPSGPRLQHLGLGILATKGAPPPPSFGPAQAPQPQPQAHRQPFAENHSPPQQSHPHQQRQPPAATHPVSRARRQAPKILPFSRLEGPGGFDGLPAPLWYTRPPGAVPRVLGVSSSRDDVQLLDVSPSPTMAAGGEWRTDNRVMAASTSAVWRNPDTLPRLAPEPPPEGAPYAELLLSLQRIGCDLCRVAAAAGTGAGSEAGVGDGLGEDVGEWLDEWHALLRQALEQLKRLLVDRAVVSSYPAQDGSGEADVQDRCSSSQVLTKHAQLQAAVELLLLQVAELPSPAGASCPGGVAGSAMDAVDYLVCKSSFADYDRCDAAARDILIGGCIKLSQLAAERLRACSLSSGVHGFQAAAAGSPGASGNGGGGAASESWQEVLGLALQRLAGWLLQQSQVVVDMGEVADLTMEARRLRLLGPQQLGGLQWCDATSSHPASGAHRDVLFTRLAAEHRNVLSRLCRRLTVLVRAVGRPLAELLLQPATVQALLQPDRPRDPCRNDKLLLLSTAVQVLALQQQQHPAPGGGKGSSGTTQLGFAPPADPQSPTTLGPGGGGIYELVVASQLQVVVERLLHFDYATPVDLSVHAITPQPPCRDYAVPLLGFLHALTQHANNQPGTSHVQRATLGSWDRIEGAAAAAVGFVGGGSGAFLRRVWESRLEPHQRMLAVALLANAARGLVALRRGDLVAGALLPARPSPAKEQLGLLGVWLRLAMESGNDRAMLQVLTAELLRAPEAQALFCCPSAGSASPETVAAGICGRSEAVAEQVLAALSALAQQRQQLPAPEAQQRSGQLLALLEGLDTALLHLNEELRRSDAAACGPATGDVVGREPPPVRPATLQAHRHMASVVLAAHAACAGGALDLHAALGSVLLGGGGGAGGAGGGAGRLDAARWERAQSAVRVLELAVAMAVEDVASVTYHASCEEAAVQRWHEVLRYRSSGGLLAELWAVVTHVFDSRADLAPMQGKSSVQTRCLVLLSSLVTELPGAEDTPEHAKAEKLRLLAARAVAQQLAPPPGAAGPSASAARDSAARALHRCVTSGVRQYCKVGLGAHLKTALVRHAMNALAWLRELLRQPELRQPEVAERLMPALLCLAAEVLCEVRGQLLAQQLLAADGEAAGPGTTQPTQPQPASDVLSRRRLSLRLVGAVLEAAADVMKLAAEGGLLAMQEQAGKTEKGSVHIESSPLQCMEAAARAPLRAAVGCTLGLLLRVCVECSVVWLRPDHSSTQSAVLTAQLPPPGEHRREVLGRLSSCAGFPAPAEEWQAVRNELRASSSPHVSKLTGRPPHQEDADEAVSLSVKALACLARLAEECGAEGRSYMAMPHACMRTLLHQFKAVDLTRDQKASLAAFMKALKPSSATAQPHGAPKPVQQPQPQARTALLVVQAQRRAPLQQQPDPSTQSDMMPSAPQGLPQQPPAQQQQQQQQPLHAPQASQAGQSRVQPQAQQQQQQRRQQQQRLAPRLSGSMAMTVASSQPFAAAAEQDEHKLKRKRQEPGVHDQGGHDAVAGAAAGGGGGAVSGTAGGGRSGGSSASDREASTEPVVYAAGRAMVTGSQEYEAMLAGAVPFADLQAWYNDRDQEHQRLRQSGGNIPVPALVARVRKCNATSKLASGQLCSTVELVDGSPSGPPSVLLYTTGQEPVIRDVHAALSRQPMVALYGAFLFKGEPLQAGKQLRVRLHIDASGACGGLVVRPHCARADQVRRALQGRARTSASGGAPGEGQGGRRTPQLPAPGPTQQEPLATAPAAGTAPATLPRGGHTSVRADEPGLQAGAGQAAGPQQAPGLVQAPPAPQRHVTPWRGVFAAPSEDEDDQPVARHGIAGDEEEGAEYIPATQDPDG